jgi:hypothetical protein
MTRPLLLLLALCAGSPVWAVPIGEPSGLVWDQEALRLYVADRADGGRIWAIGTDGVLILFSEVPEQPAGLARLGTRLWVADGERVRAFEVGNAAPSAVSLPQPGADLGDLSSDGQRVYALDRALRRIYVVDQNQGPSPVLVPVVTDTFYTPIGFDYLPAADEFRVTTAGAFQGWIFRFQMTGTVTGTWGGGITTELGNLGGTTYDCAGNLYFGAVGSQSLWVWPAPQAIVTPVRRVLNGIGTPGDLVYAGEYGRLILADPVAGGLRYLAAPGCRGGLFGDGFEE